MTPFCFCSAVLVAFLQKDSRGAKGAFPPLFFSPLWIHLAVSPQAWLSEISGWALTRCDTGQSVLALQSAARHAMGSISVVGFFSWFLSDFPFGTLLFCLKIFCVISQCCLEDSEGIEVRQEYGTDVFGKSTACRVGLEVDRTAPGDSWAGYSQIVGITCIVILRQAEGTGDTAGSLLPLGQISFYCWLVCRHIWGFSKRKGGSFSLLEIPQTSFANTNILFIRGIWGIWSLAFVWIFYVISCANQGFLTWLCHSKASWWWWAKLSCFTAECVS